MDQAATPRRTRSGEARCSGHPTFELADTEAGELEAATEAVRRAGTPLLAIGRSDFPLPTLGPRLEELAASLETEPGFAVVSGLPHRRCSEDALRTMFWGVTTHLGRAVPQDALGRTVRHVVPGDRETRPHTDGSDVAAHLALPGGHTIVDLASTSAVLDRVTWRSRQLASYLFRSFGWMEDVATASIPRTVPLACRHGGKLSMRYDRAAIEAAQGHRGVRPLARDEVASFNLIDAASVDPALRTTVTLHPGDVLLINNYAVLHQIAADAHTLRIWLTLREGRPLPAGFSWPCTTYGGEPARGGVKPRDEITHSDHGVHRSGLATPA